MDDLRERVEGAILSLDNWSGGGHLYVDKASKAILTEIAKTHRLVKLGTGTHGTYSRYTNGRCRCDLCREANRERGRRYRKEIKDRALAEAPHNCDKEFDPTCVYCVGADPIDWMG